MAGERSFQLSDAYANKTLDGASFALPSGETYDVNQKLSEGGGTITTTDEVTASHLAGFEGLKEVSPQPQAAASAKASARQEKRFGGAEDDKEKEG